MKAIAIVLVTGCLVTAVTADTPSNKLTIVELAKSIEKDDVSKSTPFYDKIYQRRRELVQAVNEMLKKVLHGSVYY